MSLTNTPNQGFPLVQLGDPPTKLPATMQALANAVDAKAVQLDADAARVASPNIVKISCTAGYVAANDPSPSVGPLFDTVVVNQGTPTDLSVFNGLLLNPGLWLVGFEARVKPLANSQDILPTISMSTSNNDPFSGLGYLSWDLQTATQAFGMSNIFTPPIYGPPYQYLNGCAPALVPSNSFRVRLTGLFNIIDVPAMTMWAVQIGDL